MIECTEVLRNNGTKLGRGWKELFYTKAATLGDVEEAMRWWQDNLVR